MTDVTVYGFPISTFVNIVRLVLTYKNVAFDFHDLEPEMGGPRHLSLHPFNRVPILDQAGFRIYETSAIAIYVDEAFEGNLTATEGLAPARQDVSMDQCSKQLLHVLSFKP
jgi:glutathione S-transferase